MIRTLALLLLAAITAPAFAQPGVPVDGKALVEALRKGGHVVYFRHTKTLPEHAHEAKMRREGRWRLDDCATQRNLSEAGYLEAKKQSEALDKLGIPYGNAWASQACRTRIHAEFVVQKFAFADALTPLRNKEKAQAVRRMLNTPPPEGTNTFLFAHGGILWMATDYDSVEAETFVFRPSTGGGPPALVAAIRIEDWDRLLRGERCCAPRAFWGGKGEPQVD